MTRVEIACACGHTVLEVVGEPILVSECLCDSCRAAASRFAALPRGRDILTPYGATPCAEVRKDRVRVVPGGEALRELRLRPDAATRRVVATCCDTPVFVELGGAHWVGLYLHLWPAAARPTPTLRTMVGDRADRSGLPDDLPNLNRHTPSFYLRLFAAWVAMGFRNPPIRVAGARGA
jgi:hypothetical protein